MAAFFMISGYGFYKRKPHKCFAIQRKLLLLPYCIVAAAVIISKFLLAVVRQRSFMENGGEFVLTYLLGRRVCPDLSAGTKCRRRRYTVGDSGRIGQYLLVRARTVRRLADL